MSYRTDVGKVPIHGNKTQEVYQLIQSNDLLTQIKNNTSNINVNVDSLEVNTDGLETLQTSANNTLSSIDNKIILPSVLDSDRLKVYDSAVVGSLSNINNNIDDVESKLDTIDGSINTIEACINSNKMDVNIASGSVSISGGSTEAKQDTVISTIVDTNNKIDALRGSNSITDIVSKLSAGLPSALSGDKLKCVLDANLQDTNNKIDVLITNISTLNTTNTNGFNMVDSAVSNVEDDTDNLQTLITSSNTKLDIIDGSINTIEACVNSNKLNINIGNGGTTGQWFSSSTVANDNFSAVLDCTAFKSVRLFGLFNATLFSGLTVMGSQISSGTYYAIPENLAQNIQTISGVTYYYCGVVIDKVPNFIKILNNTGSSVTFELDYVGYIN